MTTGNPKALRGVPSHGVLGAELRVEGEGVLDIEGETHEQISQWFVDFAVVGIGHCDSPQR
ncbi:unannotated protein [freshwater metagenome]|uniref:Unannotated protein n=1 Tax=freshwater metagenome TaxID=449393 RepID=A0A6J6HH34_9ZZZZ